MWTEAFMFGMPVILAAGGLIVLFFAKRASKEIDSHWIGGTPVE